MNNTTALVLLPADTSSAALLAPLYRTVTAVGEAWVFPSISISSSEGKKKDDDDDDGLGARGDMGCECFDPDCELRFFFFVTRLRKPE